MIITPFILKNIEVENNRLVWTGSNDKVSITDDNKKVTLKFNDHIIIADASSDEVNTKYIEILNNNPKYLIIIYIEVGYLFLIISLFLYSIILSRLEKLFININEGDTPFTLENVKHIKQMAFLMIASIILPNISGILFELILKSNLDIRLELSDVVQILFLFGMSYIFEYGYELQQDTKAKMYGETSNNE